MWGSLKWCFRLTSFSPFQGCWADLFHVAALPNPDFHLSSKLSSVSKKKKKVLAEISQQLLDDCPWNFLLVFRGTRAWKKDFDLLTFHLFCFVRGVSWKLEARLMQKTLIFSGKQWNTSRMECIDVCVSHRMNPGHVSDSVGWITMQTFIFPRGWFFSHHHHNILLTNSE